LVFSDGAWAASALYLAEEEDDLDPTQQEEEEGLLLQTREYCGQLKVDSQGRVSSKYSHNDVLLRKRA
jgi:hypothetical protein